MNIWITRHGQTDLNKQKLMQGRIDKPLNQNGQNQAALVHDAIFADADLKFDAVYASPLDRAITTASIIAGIPKEQVLVDDRIIETDFGKYDCKPYALMGIPMTLYWALPEVFPAPKTVESVSSMVARSTEFLRELETHEGEYENVLIVCHGGIIRALRGYLEDKKNGITWRPKPKNCEVRVYKSEKGKHTYVNQILP